MFENVFCVIIRDQPDVLHGDDGVEEQLKTLPVVGSREPEHVKSSQTENTD